MYWSPVLGLDNWYLWASPEMNSAMTGFPSSSILLHISASTFRHIQNFPTPTPYQWSSHCYPNEKWNTHVVELIHSFHGEVRLKALQPSAFVATINASRWYSSKYSMALDMVFRYCGFSWGSPSVTIIIFFFLSFSLKLSKNSGNDLTLFMSCKWLYAEERVCFALLIAT